jgi:hypothetical protein
MNRGNARAAAISWRKMRCRSGIGIRRDLLNPKIEIRNPNDELRLLVLRHNADLAVALGVGHFDFGDVIQLPF